jgi:hypothetical protein
MKRRRETGLNSDRLTSWVRTDRGRWEECSSALCVCFDEYSHHNTAEDIKENTETYGNLICEFSALIIFCKRRTKHCIVAAYIFPVVPIMAKVCACKFLNCMRLVVRIRVTLQLTVSQPTLALSPSGTHDKILAVVKTVAVLFVVGVLPDERTGLCEQYMR